MNNEFNNQNMNQFQNNNMNSQYSNNYNNMDNQNSNKGSNNGLIVVLVIIIIALAGACLYLVFDKKDSDVNNNKDNNIQENENNNLGIHTKEEIKQFVYEFPYSKVLNTEHSYNELWYTYVTKEVFSNMNSTSITIYSEDDERTKYEDALSKKDSDGNAYPRYEFGSEEHVYMLLGLTVNEINNKELDLELFCGGCSVSVVDGNEFKNKVEKLFGNLDDMFNKSFELSEGNLAFTNNVHTYYYDKGINKLFSIVRGGGTGILPFTKVEILNEKEQSNEYIIEFVEGYFEFDSNNNKINLKNDDKSTTVIDMYNNSSEYEIDSKFEIEYKNLLKNNQDKLNKYEIVFEKSNSGYSYKTIRKI